MWLIRCYQKKIKEIGRKLLYKAFIHLFSVTLDKVCRWKLKWLHSVARRAGSHLAFCVRAGTVRTPPTASEPRPTHSRVSLCCERTGRGLVIWREKPRPHALNMRWESLWSFTTQLCQDTQEDTPKPGEKCPKHASTCVSHRPAELLRQKSWTKKKLAN